MDQAPDRIGAYTFSRKAAGEIFDEIIGYLLEAAEDETSAAIASERMGEERAAPEFEQDLRRVFEQLHRLRIGTLDSRIAQMLSAASVELGLPAEFAVLDRESSEYRRLQFQILNALFGGGQREQPDQDLFLQLFDEATHGKAEKHLFRELETYIASHRVAYLRFPDVETWKGPTLSDPPQRLESFERDHLAETLLERIPTVITHKSLLKSVIAVIHACRTMEKGSRWSRHMPKSKVLTELLRKEAPVLHYGKTAYPVEEDLYQDLQALLDHVCAQQVEEVQARTLAMYGFLNVYEQACRRQLLPGGTLAFEDACDLMSRFEDLTPAEFAFRLDGEIDHWMLDEFQDTNQLQWKVLLPFLDEVRMDPERRRSFFYVGDVKQAIYGWRGGDSELFGQIQQDWPGMQRESLDVSFRSAQPVLDLVNLLMDQIPCQDQLSSEGIQRWNQEFSAHSAANPSLPGFSQVLRCESQDTVIEDSIVEIVKTLPEKRDVAILVRTNSEGRQYAETLRAEGFQVSLEGSSPAKDDTGVELVLAALKLAAHPGDRFCRTFLNLAGLETNPAALLQAVTREGMAPVLQSVMETLCLREKADFSRHRLERLMALAFEFDQSGDRSIDRFLSFVDQAHIKEHEAHGLIRIMTIHQSKGLGFDAVILPIGESASMCNLRHGELGVSTAEPEHPRLTLLPPKDISQRIPEYRKIYQQQEADTTYETLCVLYVALTRAKQSLHVLLPPAPKKGSGSVTKTGHWIADRLPGPQESAVPLPKGMVCWFETGTSKLWPSSGSRIPPESSPKPPLYLKEGQPSLSRLEPSQADQGETRPDRLFHPIPSDGRHMGTRVHELMCQVEWADSLQADVFLTQAEEPLDSDVASHVRTLLNLPELRKPETFVTLWQEKKFESVLPDGWVTGIFDRVVLLEHGVILQDFKTNRYTGPETVNHYRPQMQMYRRVLADMLSLDPSTIRCQLLFSATGNVVEVE